jgi:hypothetical protein
MRKARLAVVAGVCGIVLGAGVAYAAIPDGGGVFHACYKTNGGSVRLVNSATDCNSSESATQWSQTGPQGPQGPAGPQGDPGVFSGAFESPNHMYKLEVTDSGIAMTGPMGKILLGNDGIEVTSQGLNGVVLKSPGAEVGVTGPTVTVNGSATVNVTGGLVQLNGCLPIARVTDLVNVTGPIGVIATGSSRVCAG